MELVILVIGFVIGTVLGSFIKATTDRAEKEISFRGRSYCESCKTQLKWYDLFPIFSYLSLKGKCRYCKKKIPPANFYFEVGMGILIAWLFSTITPQEINTLFLPSWQTAIFVSSFLFKLFVVTILVVVAAIDYKTGLILDKITFPAVVITSIYLVISTVMQAGVFYYQLTKNPLGKYLLPPYTSYFLDITQRQWMGLLWSFLMAVVVSAVFILLIIITRGRGMGWGDVKYVFWLGLILGFPNIFVGLFISFLSGAAFSLILIALKRKGIKQTIPFGPFLSLGAFIAFFWGNQLLNWYLNSFN